VNVLEVNLFVSDLFNSFIHTFDWFLVESSVVIVCRIVKACRTAERLAIENFDSVEVTSACIVFILLLEQDVTVLRLHLQVASQLAEYSFDDIAALLSNQNSCVANTDSTRDLLVTKKISKCNV